MSRILALLKESFSVFQAKGAASRGAAMAFYAATSIAPVLLIVIAVAGLVFGQDAARGAIFGQFRGLLGAQSADFLQMAIESASNKSAGVVASLIGIATLIITASGVFIEMETALNDIWEVKPSNEGITAFVRARIASLGLVFALGFLLLISLVIDAALQGLSGFINSYLPFGAVVLLAVSFVVSFALNAVLIAAMYKILPDRSLAWRDVIFGAIVTAALFEIGKKLISLYLGTSSAATSLGAAGALLGLLFWVYYSAQIFLFGAALTKTYSAGAFAGTPKTATARAVQKKAAENKSQKEQLSPR